MDNFESAFRLGINAAREVQHRKAEVELVLKEFSASLEVESNGFLNIQVKRSTNALAGIIGGFISNPLDAGLGLFVTIKGEPAQAVQIAGWKQSESGYPCWIMVSGKEIACLDRAGLEEELARLAASPQMGSAIIDLLKQVSPQE